MALPVLRGGAWKTWGILNIMQKAVATLSASLRSWADQTRPIARGAAVPIACIDRGGALGRLRDLFFNLEAPDSIAPVPGQETVFLRGQVMSTDAVRNSLYPRLFLAHGDARRLGLHFTGSGAFGYRLCLAGDGGKSEVIDAGVIEASGGAGDGPALPAPCATLSLERDLDDPGRLFWELEALSDDALLSDAAWSLEAPRDGEGRMVVVLRTFGRDADVRALLEGFEQQARQNPVHAGILRNVFFLLLATTPGTTAEDYAGLGDFEHIRAHVIFGANLGGGGNMGQALALLEEALDAARLSPDELLLLDDDLQISLESLCRHWAASLLRTDDTIFTLPVCTSSAPRTIWEDGAFWGRFLGRTMPEDRVEIAPRFLRHGVDLGAAGQADAMAGLHYPEYSTFIFFGLSFERFRTLGYPPAFFLRGDDIEYSLRHGKAGGRCLSNPNLCAWHEPAHSHAQEYMSIAHGVIINMAHGTTGRDGFLRFFQRRLMAHAALYDAHGLGLYGAVLRDLNDRSLFLEHGFADRYVEILKGFRGFDAAYRYLPGELRSEIRKNAESRGRRVAEAPFLYPPVEAGDVPERVILSNPHSGLHRLYEPEAPDNLAACVEAAALFAAQLERFRTGYEAISAHYLGRLDAVSERKFWLKEIARHAAPATLFSRT